MISEIRSPDVSVVAVEWRRLLVGRQRVTDEFSRLAREEMSVDPGKGVGR